MTKYRNILVHSLVNIGDVLLSTSAVALLKQAYPEAKITMMVRPSAAEIVQNNPVIDDVIIYDYQARHKSLRQTLAMAGELRKRRFDLSISLDRKLRPAILTWLAGIPVRVGPDRVFDDKKSWVTKLFTHTVTTPSDFRHTHQTEIFQSIVRGFFGIEGSAKPVMGRVMAINREKARQLINQLPRHKYRVGLCVKGTYPTKNWPQEQFARLIDILAESYRNVAFFIVGMQDDRSYADEVIAQSHHPVTNFCGETSLLDLKALLAESNLFITIDTGAMHIAATTPVFIIGIFRCVSADRWRPITPSAQVVYRHLDICPLTGAPEKCPQNDCVKQIPLEDVVSLADTALHRIIGDQKSSG